MGLLFWRARVRRTNIMRLILGPRANDDEHVQLSLARRLFRFLLLISVMLMLIIAIARPTWKLQLVPYQTRGRDLMVLFDVSKSMLAQDIKPSRLAHAKLFLRELINQSGSDRFGLVAFAGRAFLECPMTTDKTSFTQYIDELDTESIPLGGTNLQLALQTAMKAFNAAEGNNRAIILITDGDELTGNSKLALAELKKAKIPLLIVGVGNSTEPALIPVPREKGQSVKFMRDNKGELVKTRLNVALMEQLASATDGCFVHSTTTNFGLEQIEAGIKKLLPEELEKGEKTRPIERFYYFLAFATILLWLWLLISEHPGKKRQQAAKLAAVFIISVWLAGQNTANAQQQQPTLPASPAQPQVTAQNEKEAEPPVTDPVTAYNQAREIQLKKKGDYAKLYETAINLADKNPTVRIDSFNNLGVAEQQKARQAVMQAYAQVKQQNLDGAISQLEGAKKILDTAEEMYVKAFSTKAPETPEIPDKEKELAEKNARNQTAINQQLLLNDRVLIDKLIKKIKELKKQQQKAQKQTQKAQKQQQQKNKQQQQKNKQQQQKQQNKQQQQKQQNKQQQQKQQNKQQQQKQQQKQQNKQQQNKQKQQNKQQNKQQQNKQQQQKPQQDELEKAQKDVKKLENDAKNLGQKKIEKQAQKAKEELDKAQKAREEQQGKKAEEHIKKALKELMPQGSDKNKKKQDKNKKGQGQNKKNEQKKQNEKKDQGKQGKNKQLPKPQPQPAQAAKAEKAPKDINPKEARKLLKLMTEKEKDFRKALKAYQKQQYKNTEVEKDW